MAKLKPLSFKGKEPYDGLINSIRQTDGIALNRSLLGKVATDSYVLSMTKNGKFDSRSLVEYFKNKNAERDSKNIKVRLEAKENKLKEKLAEIQTARKI